MVLYLDPDRRSGPGRGAGPGGPSHAPKLTFVAPLGLPPNDSHQSCTPWSVFQDGSVHSTALMTGRAGRPVPCRDTVRPGPPASTNVDTCDPHLRPSGVYKAAARGGATFPRGVCRASHADQPGQGRGTGRPGWADPGAPCPGAE